MVVTGKLSISTLTGTLLTSSATAVRQTIEDDGSVPPVTLEQAFFELKAFPLHPVDCEMNELQMQWWDNHLRMLHCLSPIKTSLWNPESRYLPVSVTAVPPNAGPELGWRSVMLGSCTQTCGAVDAKLAMASFMHAPEGKLSYHKREALHLSSAFDGVAALHFSLVHLQIYLQVLARFVLSLNLTHQPEARKDDKRGET